MTALIADAVFDAALSYIASNAIYAQVQSAASAVLVNSIALDASNFGAPGNNVGAGGGRKITCLVEDTGDMSNIEVDAAGDATKVVLLADDSPIVPLITADITDAPKTLGADDQVNLGTFDVILKDPT
jgi:hypothetical protein